MCDGGEVAEDAALEFGVGEAVGLVHDVELAGEALLTRSISSALCFRGISRTVAKTVFLGVHGGTAFTGFGAGAGGEAGIGDIGEELRVADGVRGFFGGGYGGAFPVRFGGPGMLPAWFRNNRRGLQDMGWIFVRC